MNKTCETCRFWERFDRDLPYGWCHCHAPHMRINISQGASETDGIWPNPKQDDWCGEWQEKEIPENSAESS